jgi:hypothetical protein
MKFLRVFGLGAPVLALLLMIGCASLGSSSTESLLSAAGFVTKTPATNEQIALFNRLPGYQLQRKERNGKVIYTYADKQKGIVYIGSEAAYQQYKKLGLQKSIAENQLEAAQLNEEATMDWSPFFGPWVTW